MANGNISTTTDWDTTGRSAMSALLVAADNRNLHHLADPLKKSHWTLLFARNSSEVQSALSAGSIPLVIVDGDSGTCFWKDLLKQAALLNDTHKPKFVVASQNADGRLWAEVLNLGGYDLLMKPLDAHEVAWLTKSALAERNGSDSPKLAPRLEECTAWNGS